MREFTVRVKNLRGLHARAASMLVQEANRFACNIRIIKDHIVSDGKSILGVLLLAAAQGTVLTIQVEGADEEEAHAAIRDLFERGFYEDRDSADTDVSDDSIDERR